MRERAASIGATLAVDVRARAAAPGYAARSSPVSGRARPEEACSVSIRVLLADDHRMLREGLRRSLTDEGFDVVGEADNGEQAVRLAAELQPDVVLMDVSMPEMDGVEATRPIRATDTDDPRR